VATAIAQYGTAQPGQPTDARVWIENRTGADAVPIVIHDVSSTAAPLRVVLDGAPAVTLNQSSVVDTRSSRQAWEYETLTMSGGEPAIPTLNREGAQGWEVIGVISVSSDIVHYVMKRPH
jgi:hypothetical protein